MLAQDLIPDNAETELISTLLDALDGQLPDIPSVDEMLDYVAGGEGLHLAL